MREIANWQTQAAFDVTTNITAIPLSSDVPEDHKHMLVNSQHCLLFYVLRNVMICEI